MGGLVQGIVSIGINYATEELDLDPLLANIGFSAIAAAVNAGIQAATGGEQDVFKSFFDTYMDNALTFLGYSDITNPNYLFLKTSYMQNILDFTDIIRSKDGIDGLIDALNIYGSSFFNSTTIGAIAQSGKTIGKFFADKLKNGEHATRTLPNKKVVEEVAVPDNENNTVANAFFEEKQDGDSLYWDFIGIEYVTSYGTYLDYGDLGVDQYAKLGFTDADLYIYDDLGTQFQRIANGEQAYAEVKDFDGNTILVISPAEDGGYNYYDNFGQYVDAKIEEFNRSITVNLEDGLVEYYNNYFNYLSTDDIQWLAEYGFTAEDLYNAQISWTKSSDGTVIGQLYWSTPEQAEEIWTKSIQSGIWSTVQERFKNAAQWLGFRTNNEIQEHIYQENERLQTMGQSGDIIFVNGKGPSADLTKNITQGPTNHTAMLYVDSNGERWVLEMLFDTGLQKIKLSEFMDRMVTEGNDIQVGRRNNVDTEVMYTTIQQELFLPGTEEVKNIPYNTPNLFTINGQSSKAFICSGMIEYIYREARLPLFVTDQLQYSPVDIYNEIDKIGSKY